MAMGHRDDGIRPRLSIAIPTYRRFDLLAEALSSALAQRFEIPIEILIVDNDPDNDAVALDAMHVFMDQPVSYYKNDTNVGMVMNWNRCLELARGEYVTILHDDDLLEPGFAEEVNRHLGPGVPWDRHSPGDTACWTSGRNGRLPARLHRCAGCCDG